MSDNTSRIVIDAENMDSNQPIRRPYMRSVPCAIECRADGTAVYACIGDVSLALRGEAGVIGYGDTLADALRDLADEIEREVGWDESRHTEAEIQRLTADRDSWRRTCEAEHHRGPDHG